MTYIDDLKFKNLVEDLDAHFSDAKVSNFDIIHHQWWGDPLQYSKCYYETTFNNDFQHFEDRTCNHTIFSAIKAERDDIHFECDLLKLHMKSDIEKNLISNGIFIRKSRKNIWRVTLEALARDVNNILLSSRVWFFLVFQTCCLQNIKHRLKRVFLLLIIKWELKRNSLGQRTSKHYWMFGWRLKVVAYL